MDAKQLAALRETLAAFEGVWEGDEEIASSPVVREGAARGRHVMRRAVDGSILVQDYERRRDDGTRPISGHGVFAVDPTSGVITWFFFDSLGYLPNEPARGGWHEGGLLLAKSTRRGEARYHFRVEGRRLVHHIEGKPAGAADFTTFLAGNYRKVG